MAATDLPGAVAPPPASDLDLTEPRWPAVISALAVAIIYTAVPASMRMGPPWLLIAIVLALLVPTIVAHRVGHTAINDAAGYAVLVAVTLALLWALYGFVHALPAHTDSAAALLRSAAMLWVANVLVFACWYWRVDGGGPNERDVRRRLGHGHLHAGSAFLFPQLTLPPAMTDAEQRPWNPEFVDYLFLAFNTSTAFSPTDAPVLSRWAKAMMMVQAMISFTSIVVLAARAVNTL